MVMMRQYSTQLQDKFMSNKYSFKIRTLYEPGGGQINYVLYIVKLESKKETIKVKKEI